VNDSVPSSGGVYLPKCIVPLFAGSVKRRVAGIHAGHVSVSRYPRGVRLSFAALAGGQPAMMGDTLHTREKETLSFHQGNWCARSTVS
jgi:hypothetical protein